MNLKKLAVVLATTAVTAAFVVAVLRPLKKWIQSTDRLPVDDHGHNRGISDLGRSSEAWDTGLVLSACDGPRNQEIHFRGYTEPRDSSRPVLEWTTTAQPGEVFPLPGNVGQPVSCRIFTSKDGDGPPGPLASLRVGALPFSQAAPAPTNAFVQFGGTTTLNHEVRASALFEPADADGGVAPSVTVLTRRAGEPAVVYERLRAGDTFGWGRHRATVVRLVEPHTPYVGWVEVALAPPSIR